MHQRGHRVLVVEAHPDDAVVGAGGTIAKLINEANPVKWIYFAPCQEDPRNEGLLSEHYNALKDLGMDMDNLITCDMPRNVLENKKDYIRHKLWNIKKKYNPTLVICPSVHEYHQDHKAVAECCATIFRDTATILAYEVLRSVSPDFQPNCFISLPEAYYSKKMCALWQFKTQKLARPYFFRNEIFLANMRMRGTQINATVAEAFEVVRMRVAEGQEL